MAEDVVMWDESGRLDLVSLMVGYLKVIIGRECLSEGREFGFGFVLLDSRLYINWVYLFVYRALWTYESLNME